MSHPFDRYSTFTDVQALKEISSQALRKSVRINTLKMSVQDFEAWAKKAGWQLEQVPWCNEGFYIDRDNRSQALGKDLLHLLGYIYMQEAASMLPVALLDPQPGETVLDMAAAPGSKTTQMAAMMENTGVIIANDVQPKRLATLKTALHRLGVTNYIMTKKNGQWFAKYMTEQFDRVLCDAPCTAQGTARKDPTALNYCSDANTRKMSKVQKSLLESAVHACKVGGRVVYSTCTLTPEENEEVVGWLLNKYCDQLEIVDTRDSRFGSGIRDMQQAVDDSMLVQESIPNSESQIPMLRLWPQAYNTEGFFCAVIQKNAPTLHPESYDRVLFQERPIKRKTEDHLTAQIEKVYGTSFINSNEQLFERPDGILLANKDILHCHLPVQNYSLGLPFGKSVRGKEFRLSHELVTARGRMTKNNVIDLADDQLQQILDGKDIECDADLSGDVLLQWNGMTIGLGLAKKGRLKNNVSRWLVQHRVQ